MSKILYKLILKPILFLFDPEFIHNLFVDVGYKISKSKFLKGILHTTYFYSHHMLRQEIDGIKYDNPVGLGAGFDKEVKLIGILKDISFGAMELGSLTLKPYEGNPKPRLLRLKKSKGILVNYGLKNPGVYESIKRIKELDIPEGFVLGISIAKTNSKETANEDMAINDYFATYTELQDSNVGDFYTINISCPNTFNGEPFTTPKRLEKLLLRINSVVKRAPIYLKMPINLKWEDFDKLLHIAVKYKIDGVVIGNLNKNRKDESIKDNVSKDIVGSISGRPTWELSNKLIRKTYLKYGDKLTIIGVGGIFSAKDAYTKIKLGASLVQLVTGMIFEGPQLMRDINKGIVKLLKKDGYRNIKEAIGVDADKIS